MWDRMTTICTAKKRFKTLLLKKSKIKPKKGGQFSKQNRTFSAKCTKSKRIEREKFTSNNKN